MQKLNIAKTRYINEINIPIIPKERFFSLFPSKLSTPQTPRTKPINWNKSKGYRNIEMKLKQNDKTQSTFVWSLS